MNNNLNFILLGTPLHSTAQRSTKQKKKKLTENSFCYHYSEPCHLDCGLDGKCDNSEQMAMRCLCPFGKGGNKCENGRQIHNFVCIYDCDDWGHICIFSIWSYAKRGNDSNFFFSRTLLIELYFGMVNSLLTYTTANSFFFLVQSRIFRVAFFVEHRHTPSEKQIERETESVIWAIFAGVISFAARRSGFVSIASDLVFSRVVPRFRNGPVDSVLCVQCDNSIKVKQQPSIAQ